jgi:hypothetical protein
MPNTYTQLLFHIVFSTKNRQRTLPVGNQELLYRCSMSTGDCPAKTAFRTTNDIWREICRATTWHTQQMNPSPRVPLRSTRGYSRVTATRSQTRCVCLFLAL